MGLSYGLEHPYVSSPFQVLEAHEKTV